MQSLYLCNSSSTLLTPTYSSIAQLVEQRPDTSKVVGSTPAVTTFWGAMFQGGDVPLQGMCVGFDFLAFHKNKFGRFKLMFYLCIMIRNNWHTTFPCNQFQPDAGEGMSDTDDKG